VRVAEQERRIEAGTALALPWTKKSLSRHTTLEDNDAAEPRRQGTTAGEIARAPGRRFGAELGRTQGEGG